MLAGLDEAVERRLRAAKHQRAGREWRDVTRWEYIERPTSRSSTSAALQATLPGISVSVLSASCVLFWSVVR
jgi:hypothetical protein